MALAAGLMLAGCSKSDGDEPAPQYKLTKDNIVGVWRSDDYWVSFSSDGYMSAYLSDKCIAEGDYTIDKDTVKVTDGNPWIKAYSGMNTRFTVNSVKDNALSLTALYNDLHILYRGDEGLVHHITQSYSLSKTQETPCTKQNPLTGKNCSFPMDIWYYKYQPGVTEAILTKTPGTCTITVDTHNKMTVTMLADDKKIGDAGETIEYMYIYLAPKIYMISSGIFGGRFEKDRPIKIYEPTFNADGSIEIPYSYPDDIK